MLVSMVQSIKTGTCTDWGPVALDNGKLMDRNCRPGKGGGFLMNELNYFTIDGAIGWNQDWFKEWWMNKGGCAAVTACDLCLYLAREKGLAALYPFDAAHPRKEDYLLFSDIMSPICGRGGAGSIRWRSTFPACRLIWRILEFPASKEQGWRGPPHGRRRRI